MPRDASDLARRLARDAEAVCRHYLSKGRRQGRYWTVGDVRNTPGRSMFVRLSGPDSGPGAAGRWSTEEFQARLLDTRPPLVVDVRTRADFEGPAGHIDGALNLPLEELARKCGAWGFDGLELACWGDHFDVDRALGFWADRLCSRLEARTRGTR